MKRFILTSLVLPILFLGACSEGNEDEEVDQTQQENNSVQEDEKKQTKEKDSDRTEVDTFGGDFEAVAHREDIEKVKVGPLTINVVVSNLVKGTITDSFILDNIGKENIDYINIGLEIDTTEEDINFSSKHLKLTTNTGESFEAPHDYMSDQVEMQYIKENYTRSRMISYLFETSTVEEIESVDFLIKAPTDNNGQPLGEDAKIQIDF
ncbi:hypothetical protein GLW00_06860 [Halobacillus litoralis]|uniref:DUF4352 domain-containing protein n=1 Tax=Halobacillus litoralis TaxID=45668 RepID=A0A845F9M5_9BACI|nr:hypothetical protein [Halobacillus litoralis]MYL70561.1 hypothetical protein [Halobacillus litoralis]